MKRSVVSYPGHTEMYSELMMRLFPNDFKGYDSKHKTVTYQVTEDCNLKCTYCYQTNKSKSAMTWEVAKKYTDMLFDEYADDKYLHVPLIVIEFIGGEPLLEIDLIQKICDYFELKCIQLNHPWTHRHRFSICSNGLLYFDPRVQNFLKKYHNKLSFSISIDGTKELHDACRVLPDGSGSYDIAVRSAKHYMENYDNNLGSKMTLAPENIQYITKAVPNLIELGYTEINLNCVYEDVWSNYDALVLYTQLKELADYLIDNDLVDKIYISIYNEYNYFGPMSPDDNQNWCGGVGSMLSCDPNGDLFPCIRYMKTSLNGSQTPLVIGHIDHGINVNPTEKSILNDLSLITRRSQSTDECFNCPIASGCAWCSGYNYQVFGTVNKRATFICPMHKARSLANVYLWNKWYNKLGIDESRFKMNCPEEWALQIISKSEYDMLLGLSTNT